MNLSKEQIEYQKTFLILSKFFITQKVISSELSDNNIETIYNKVEDFHINGVQSKFIKQRLREYAKLLTIIFSKELSSGYNWKYDMDYSIKQRFLNIGKLLLDLGIFQMTEDNSWRTVNGIRTKSVDDFLHYYPNQKIKITFNNKEDYDNFGELLNHYRKDFGIKYMFIHRFRPAYLTYNGIKYVKKNY